MDRGRVVEVPSLGEEVSTTDGCWWGKVRFIGGCVPREVTRVPVAHLVVFPCSYRHHYMDSVDLKIKRVKMAGKHGGR